MSKTEFTPEERRELYLKALKKKGIVPFETKTIEVGSLTDFTNVIIKEATDAV